MKISTLILILTAPLSLVAQSTPKATSHGPELAEIERERTPDLSKFEELLQRADRVVVIESNGEKETQLFESLKETDLAELRAALKLRIPEDWKESICYSPTVYFYKGPERLMSVGNVLGSEVKTSVWSGNALLEDPEKWLQWFDRRGMLQVRAERDREEAAARTHERNEKRWYEAMPRGIGDLVKEQVNAFGLPSMGKVEHFRPVLEREYPSKDERILALLHWFGSGAGGWSGHPSYESIAEDLLFLFTTREIIEAVKSRALTDTQLEGTARFFAGWEFYRDRPDDLKFVPEPLRKKLLEHALKSGDDDKRQIAIKVFGKEK